MPYKKKRNEVYDKCKGHCAYCGIPIAIKEMQIDHIVPQYNFDGYFKQYFANGYKKHIPEFLLHLNVGEMHHIDNLNPACRVCNKWKSTHHLELFRSEISEQIKRLNERSANYRMAKKYGLVKETIQDVIFHFENPNPKKQIQ